MKRIHELRKQKGLSGEELGRFVGVGKSAISKYERGAVQPSNEVLILIAKTLNTSTDYLLEYTDNPAPPSAKKEAPTVSEGVKIIENTIHSMGFEEITPPLLSAIAEMAVNNKNLIRARAKELEESGK